KCKNDYLPSPAAVKYHSHLTTCPPRHPDEFIEKCGDGHNALAPQCMLNHTQCCIKISRVFSPRLSLESANNNVRSKNDFAFVLYNQVFSIGSTKIL
ncbi:hypothetical protein AVEN_117487-1, partial [Araneus ventricosus]